MQKHEEKPVRVAVIGGGIAGLTAAYRLVQHGIAVTVFEAADRTGGVIRSERENGYLVEHGPNSLQARSPLLDKFIHELSLDAARIEANKTARKRYVVRDGTPIALPMSPPAFITNKLFSLRAKLRLLREPLIRRGSPEVEESIAAFVRRRLGRELLDYAVNPFVAGIFAGDPEMLSLRHAFPRLFALEQEYGSLLKGQIKKAKKKARSGQASPSSLFSFREGMQMLPDALADRLSGHIRLQAPVTALQPTQSGWQATFLHDGTLRRDVFDAVLYAAPLHALPDLATIPAADLQTLKNVSYPPVSIMALSFRRADVVHSLDGFGLLVPAVEQNFEILGTLFSSTLFPGRAPEGHVLLTTFLGGARRPELGRASTDQLEEIVMRDLQRLLGVRGTPVFSKHVAWERAIPQYNIGYGSVKEAIDRIEDNNSGFYMAGNYRTGISVADALTSGYDAAGRLLQSAGIRPA